MRPFNARIDFAAERRIRRSEYRWGRIGKFHHEAIRDAPARGRTILNSVNSPIDLYGPVMLLDDDVMTNGQAEPGPFTSRLCRKERVKQLLLHLRQNAGAVVAYPDFDAVTEVLGRGSKRWLIVMDQDLPLSRDSRTVKIVVDFSESCPQNVPRSEEIL